MVRRYARKKRKVRARKRIDKVQNRRIKRLEDATEKMYAYSSENVGLSSTITNTQQLYPIIPTTTMSVGTNTAGDTAEGIRIGNEVCMKRITCRTVLHNASTTESCSVRVIFFWLKQSASFATDQSTDTYSPKTTAIHPTWSQLLYNFQTAANVSVTNGYTNLATPQNQMTKSNEVPISILSDKLYHLGASELSNRTVQFTFSKSYKGLKLTYNIGSGSISVASPVNRQLFMAVVPAKVAVADNVHMYAQTVMHYTDA